MSSVSVQGSSNQSVVLSFDTSSNLALAQQIAERLNAGINAGTTHTAFDTDGTPPALPLGVSGTFFQTTTEMVSLPLGYTTDIVTKPGQAIVLGSGVAETVLSDAATDLVFIAGAGSGTVLAGGGNNRLLVSGTGGDKWSLNTGGGNDFIGALGAVSATIGAGGGHNKIQLGSGNDLITSTGDDTIAGGSAAATVDATGASSDFVQGENSHLLFVGGAGGATILGGTGSDTYFGASAGPSGNQLIKGGLAGNNLLIAGDGAATLMGAGSNDQLFSNGTSDQKLIAGAGNETLSAAFSSGNATLTAGSGKDALIGGTGADTFVGGSGQSTVTASAGSNTFEFINHQAGGSVVIQGVSDPSSVAISLKGYDPYAQAYAMASQTVSNGSVTIGLADGTKVTFDHVTALSWSNFT